MKFIFSLLFFITSITVFGQWSDTTNHFTDSLHMRVTTAPYNQGAAIIVRSYPDSGYFVIWQDSRNNPDNSKTAIYAQKYSKTGAGLWVANGIAVSASTNNQHYTYQGQDYRNHSYAATDSAGGFYLAYADDSITNYVYQRACVQHVKNNGTVVFNGPGNIISSSTSANLNLSPQLVADGTGGFFYSFVGNGTVVGTATNVFIYCYKDVNGTLQNYGGGEMNQNAVQVTATSPCGNYTYLNYPAAEVQDYNIFPDLQGGCNIVMSLSVNGQGKMLGYNKLWRAKQNATATEYYLGSDYSDSAIKITYQKGNVYRLYYLKSDYQTISCGTGSDIFVVTQYRLVQNGFEEVDGGASLYDIADPKAVTVSTAGNINASILATWKRTYAQLSGVSNPVIEGYVLKEEIYDSIPYQRTSNNNPDYPGYNTIEPANLNKLNNFRDTILAAPVNNDFSLTGGSNQVFSSAVTINYAATDFSSDVKLQHLAVEQQSADSFALVYKTSFKTGELIGKDNGDTRYGTEFDLPYVKVNNNGVGIFSIKDNIVIPGSGVSSTRVSPVFTGAQLAWGAMGKPTGTGVWNGSYYNTYNPFVLPDVANGTALMSWTDERNISTTGSDIYMRHLDDLTNPNYQPPYNKVKPVPYPYGPVNSSATLYGTTNKFTTLEVYDDNSYSSDPGVSPAVDISDNYNLGTVNVSVFDNTSGIRNYNGKPYLDRSFTITPQNNPNGAATVTLRLFFTTAQFNALKTADSSIKTPGDLAVIKQPSGTGSGSTYTFVAGEQTVIPQSWAAVDGGYYIQVEISSFSNFFIFKNEAILPLTWLGIQAQWQDKIQAKVSWQVADQENVKTYTVQHSVNSADFTDVYSVKASNQTEYSCIVPAGNSNYYRVMETDNDGKKAYSKVAALQSAASLVVSIYPNPATNVVYIQGIQKYLSLQVIDMQGNIIQQQTVTSASQSLNIASLSKGNYLLRLMNKLEVQTLKFTKQ